MRLQIFSKSKIVFSNFLKVLSTLSPQFVPKFILLDPFPSLEKTFSMVLGQDLRPTTPNSVSPEVSSMAMHFQPTTYSRGAHRNLFPSRDRGRSYIGCGNMPQHTCTQCGHLNHIVATCFIWHGYPFGYHYKTLSLQSIMLLNPHLMITMLTFNMILNTLLPSSTTNTNTSFNYCNIINLLQLLLTMVLLFLLSNLSLPPRMVIHLYIG